MAITDSQIRCMKKDFADGISVRSSAKNAGVAKVTVERWRRKWMFEDGGAGFALGYGQITQAAALTLA